MIKFSATNQNLKKILSTCLFLNYSPNYTHDGFLYFQGLLKKYIDFCHNFFQDMLNQDLVQSIGQQILLIFKYDNNQQYVSVKWSH